MVGSVLRSSDAHLEVRCQLIILLSSPEAIWEAGCQLMWMLVEADDGARMDQLDSDRVDLTTSFVVTVRV